MPSSGIARMWSAVWLAHDPITGKAKEDMTDCTYNREIGTGSALVISVFVLRSVGILSRVFGRREGQTKAKTAQLALGVLDCCGLGKSTIERGVHHPKSSRYTVVSPC